MASVTETTVDTNMDDHIRSPFQLSTKNKEKPVKLLSLPLSTSNTTTPSTTEGKENGYSRDLLSSVSSIDSVESVSLSPKSSIGSSPFSLSIKKVSKSSVGSSSAMSPILSPSSLSTTATLLNTNSQDRITELQKEINSLKKEIEAKDAKLSSSMKSIKQFWSPELKKERATRKEETEKCVILKEKHQIATSQIEVSLKIYYFEEFYCF